MDFTSSDHQRVFLTCKTIFSGENANTKSPTAITKLLKKNKAFMKPISKELGPEKLQQILLGLCGAGIFESEARARAEFPHLYQVAANHGAQNEEPEHDTTGSNGADFDDLGISQGHDEPDEVVEDEGVQLEPPGNALDLVQIAAASTLVAVPHAVQSIASLTLSRLPYETQHLILTTTQRVLEESCFDFATRWFPDLPKARGWDCAAAVELTTWPSVFKRKLPKLPRDALNITEPSLEHIFDPIREIRHSAVHRLRTTAQDVSRLVGSALSLTEALRDYARSAKLALLKAEVDAKVRALELNADSINARAASDLEGISKEREALDRKEQDVILQKKNEEREYQEAIGNILTVSVNQIFVEK